MAIRKVRLPFFVLLVFGVAFVSAMGVGSLFGFAIKGYAWSILLFVSVLALMRARRRIAFPFLIWVPWVVLLGVYLLVVGNPNALQRTLLMIMPVVVGMTVSMLLPSEPVLRQFVKVCKWSIWILWGMSLFLTGTALTGVIPESTGLAAQVMTAVLLAGLFAADYAFGAKKSLMYWWIAAALPLFAMTRTAIVAGALTFPLTLAPIKTWKRVVMLGVIGLIGMGLFFTERVQHKMFYSGHGELSDLSWDNPDFRTSGRAMTWKAIESALNAAPWFGHGANAQEVFLYKFYGKLTQPHNDWLRLRFDYGWVGTVVFGLTLLAQFLHAWWASRRATGTAKTLLLAGASGFLGYVILMYTDNILLYGAFFANLQFTMMALGYASIAAERQEAINFQRVQYQQMRNMR